MGLISIDGKGRFYEDQSCGCCVDRDRFRYVALTLAAAQAQITMPGLGQVTIGQPPQPPVPPPPGYGQAPPHERRPAHCDHLRYREHELRERVSYMSYGRERARVEDELRYVHEAREQCWHH